MKAKTPGITISGWRSIKMGAKSTVEISREEAISKILEFIHHLDNETIALILENVNDELWDKGDYRNSLGLNNFTVR